MRRRPSRRVNKAHDAFRDAADELAETVYRSSYLGVFTRNKKSKAAVLRNVLRAERRLTRLKKTVT